MSSDWREQAACRGLGPDYFHPKVGNAAVEQSAKAKAVCAGCDVGFECLSAWLAAPAYVDYGVWFGTNPPERKGLKSSGLREALGIELIRDLDDRASTSPTKSDVVGEARTRLLERDRARARRYRARKRAEKAKVAA